MPLSIKNPKAEQLALEVIQQTGETITDAVIIALAERLERIRGRKKSPNLAESIMEISKRCAELPDHDTRSPNEILGYNTQGFFEQIPGGTHHGH